MAEVNYPEYREHQSQRNTVNTSMMALLAGTRLATHTLALTEGSQHTLSEIFPAVEHINRFNLRTDVARNYLNSADSHLTAMAVTYVLAFHEDFVTSSIDFANAHGGFNIRNDRSVKAWNMHTVLFGGLTHVPSSDWSECFHLLRDMRNSMVHAGGSASQDLLNRISSLSVGAKSLWQRLARQAVSDIVQNGLVAPVAEHIFTALAVVKHLGREINNAMVAAISTAGWAKICVEDFAAVTSDQKNSSGWKRGLSGYARYEYGPLHLSDADLEAAARTGNFWTIANWG